MGKNLIPAQRRERILESLTLNKIVTITDLSDRLGVSEATVRRDLEWLEEEGILERTHGGAIMSQRIQLEPEYNQRAQRHPEEKRLIGAAAAAMLEDGDTVFINSGTTSTQVIRHIRKDANLTIVTNNLQATLDVSDVGYELILIGGAFQPKSNSVAGPFALTNLSQIYANKAIIGVDAISLKHGCTVPSDAEASIIRTMFARTNGLLICVADHSKWGMVSNFEIARLDQFDRLVTDSGLDEYARLALAELPVELVLADGTSVKA